MALKHVVAGLAALVVQSLLGGAVMSARAAESGPPAVAQHPVTETVQGVTITDPYRWLEDADSPETARFVADQMAYTQALLDRQPGRAAIRARLATLLQIGSLSDLRVAGEYVFFRKRSGTANQPTLYVSRKGEAPRALIDVGAMNAQGTTALDWYAPSHDGTRVVYGLSDNGSEISTLHVIDTDSGKIHDEAITPTRSAGIAWTKDNQGFYYTRPRDGHVPPGQELYNIRVFWHKIGENPSGDGDLMVFGEGQGLAESHQPAPDLSDDDRYLILTVERGWGETDLYLADRGKGHGPVKLNTDAHASYQGWVYRGRLYVLTNEGAPRYRLMTADAAHPERANWRELVPQGAGRLGSFRIFGGKLVLLTEQDAVNHLFIADLDGSHRREVTLPGLGTIDSLAGTWDRPALYYVYSSFNAPQTGYRLTLGSAVSERWQTVEAPGVDTAAIDVRQIFYRSKDGTRVPMFIVSRKGTVQNGQNPVLLTGYGGFDVSMTPYFGRATWFWLEHGGVFAVANLRGGGEYGEDWHKAGNLANKQNVFDDFAAAAQYLITEKWTGPDHLAIQGGSNGGLLVGAAITQHPELYRAAISAVPLLDMLRYQRFSIAKLWIPEYGSSDDPEQFRWLYAYSPYHHVVKDQLYPATLFVTADTDTRVAPLHAMKMAALMQAEAKNGRDPDRPILLRIDHQAGHGQGKPLAKIVDELADEYTFLFWQLGITP